MSKVSVLNACIEDIRYAAQSLTAIADALVDLFSSGAESEAQPATQAEPQSPKPVTLEQVRAVLAEKSRSGHTAEVRELLARHGADKLSETDPAEYPALLAEAAGIGLSEGESDG